MKPNKERVYAALVALGIWILLGRTIAMMARGHLASNVWWVAGLLAAEFLVDLTVFLGGLRWWMSGRREHRRLPLRATVVAVVLHAIRVAVYALGRTGPWIDFDIRPAYRVVPAEPVAWGFVIFASVMAALSLAAVVVIWRLRRRMSADRNGSG